LQFTVGFVIEYGTNIGRTYVNGKMRPVESIPGKGDGEKRERGGGIKENGGEGEFNYDIYDIL
jgi:hypothetical protein